MMDFAHVALFVLGLLLLSGILAGQISARIGAPVLLAFIGLGMLAGEEGIGGIVFGFSKDGIPDLNDINAAYMIGCGALSIILFDGGIRTKHDTFRLVLVPSILLATVGVAVTTLVTGMVAALVLHRSWLEGMLVAATVASTDAAAIFILLHQRSGRLAARITATLEVESGINDPVAILLTSTLVALIGGNQIKPVAMALHLCREAGLGILIGVGGGFLLSQLIKHLRLEVGLYPILALAGGIMIFGGTQILEGSGFLAVYLAGVMLGNSGIKTVPSISGFLDGLAWLMQIVLFIMLGLLVSPRALLIDLGPALAIAATLILIARPIGTAACLLPLGYSPRETGFISWVGLRGAVPIFLAMFPILAGLPDSSSLYFNVAFVVVLTSLIMQGWTVDPVLKMLKLEEPHPSQDG